MKIITVGTILIVIVFSISNFSQNKQDSLTIDYRQDKIYAIINNSSDIDTSDVNYGEGTSDFIFHSNKLAKNINYPLEICFVKNIQIENITLNLNKVAFCYIFINKENESLKILEGIDTWRSLLEQVRKFFNNVEIK